MLRSLRAVVPGYDHKKDSLRKCVGLKHTGHFFSIFLFFSLTLILPSFPNCVSFSSYLFQVVYSRCLTSKLSPAHMHTHTHTYIYIHLYKHHIYTHTYIYIYIYIYKHIDTFLHIHIHPRIPTCTASKLIIHSCAPTLFSFPTLPCSLTSLATILRSRASFDHHLVHPTLSSPPLNRLDWCIDHLADFVTKRYASDPARDSVNRQLLRKMAEQDENSEEFLQYLQENYTRATVREKHIERREKINK